MNDENTKRGREYADTFNCVKVGVRTKKDKTQAVLFDTEQRELTYKLVSEKVVKGFDESIGMEIEDSQTEQVKKEEVAKHLPSIFVDIAKYLKKEPSIELRVTYSWTTNTYDDGSKVTYRYMFKGDVETIYAEALHKDKDRLTKQLDAGKKAEERRKGEESEVPTN